MKETPNSIICLKVILMPCSPKTRPVCTLHLEHKLDLARPLWYQQENPERVYMSMLKIQYNFFFNQKHIYTSNFAFISIKPEILGEFILLQTLAVRYFFRYTKMQIIEMMIIDQTM